MGSTTKDPPQQWIETPLIPSVELSKAAGCNIFLKLDLLQPSGSFKSRGIGHMMSVALSNHPKPNSVHFFCSSGGNAGLACSTTAAALNRPVTVVVPMITTAFMISKLRDLGAEVVQVGDNFAAADKYLREELLDEDKGGVYVHPFDHPDVWTGARTVVDEIHAQMGATVVNAIVCNVGGGGLLCGIMEGVTRLKWVGGRRPKVLAMETIGADSLKQSVVAGKHITLPGMASIATSLGATRVADRAFEWGMSEGVICGTVTDEEAVVAAVQFADDARLLVEVACGATISPVYTGALKRLLGDGMSDNEWKAQNIVLEICGGSYTGFKRLGEYMKMFGL